MGGTTHGGEIGLLKYFSLFIKYCKKNLLKM